MLRNLLTRKDPTAIQRLYDEVMERGTRAALGSSLANVTVHGLDVRKILKKANEKVNFLKHADSDPDSAIQLSTLDATQKIMEAMMYYAELNLTKTKTMYAFGQWLGWHSPSNKSQMLPLPDGEYLHEKDLQVQLQFGALWLERQTAELRALHAERV